MDKLFRVDVISDTHGFLSEALLHELEGADAIIHAGDMCSRTHYEQISAIAPLHMCLGNNDFAQEYPPSVKDKVRFYLEGLRWFVCHYRERLDLVESDIAICGHTHAPFIKQEGPCLSMNPGSPTSPRTSMGPTMARLMLKPGEVVSAEIIQLPMPEERPWYMW